MITLIGNYQATATDSVPICRDDTSVTLYLLDSLAGLAAQTELLDKLAVAVLVLGLQVVKQLAALVDHLQQTLTAVVIFLVLTEVLGEFCNSL